VSVSLCAHVSVCVCLCACFLITSKVVTVPGHHAGSVKFHSTCQSVTSGPSIHSQPDKAASIPLKVPSCDAHALHAPYAEGAHACHSLASKPWPPHLRDLTSHSRVFAALLLRVDRMRLVRGELELRGVRLRDA